MTLKTNILASKTNVPISTEALQFLQLLEFNSRTEFFWQTRNKAAAVYNPPKKQPPTDDERYEIMGR